MYQVSCCTVRSDGVDTFPLRVRRPAGVGLPCYQWGSPSLRGEYHSSSQENLLGNCRVPERTPTALLQPGRRRWRHLARLGICQRVGSNQRLQRGQDHYVRLHDPMRPIEAMCPVTSLVRARLSADDTTPCLHPCPHQDLARGDAGWQRRLVGSRCPLNSEATGALWDRGEYTPSLVSLWSPLLIIRLFFFFGPDAATWGSKVISCIDALFRPASCPSAGRPSSRTTSAG
jgi:hypothetical protein